VPSSKCSSLVSETGILLNLGIELESGEYTVVLRVADHQGQEQDSTVLATVCDCTGEDVICKGRVAGGTGLPLILGILGGILLLLSKSGLVLYVKTLFRISGTVYKKEV